jgi:hypothetical protein
MNILDIIEQGARKLDIITSGQSGADNYDIHLVCSLNTFSHFISCTAISYDPKYRSYLQHCSRRWLKYGGYVESQ